MPHLNSRYDAFGETTGETGTVANKYLFAGEQYDSNLGDYYLRARYYDTDSGRFTRRDSYEGSLEVPLTLNKYIYTHSDPVNGIDPLGLANFDMGKAVEALLRVDFKLQNYEERDFDIQIAAKDPRANTIWKRRGISYKSIPFHLVSN